jgi:hypothetical protein
MLNFEIDQCQNSENFCQNPVMSGRCCQILADQILASFGLILANTVGVWPNLARFRPVKPEFCRIWPDSGHTAGV